MKKNYKKSGMLLVALLFAGISCVQSLKAQTMTSGNGWTTPDMLKDGLTASGYEFGGGIPCWAVFDYTSTSTNPVTWNSYTITAASNIDQCATGWEIAASNDNNNWTVLDTRTGIVWTGNTEAKAYSFANATSYSYYKLTITNSNVGWGAFVGELTFASSGTTKLNDAKINPITVNTNSSRTQLTINFVKQVSSEEVGVFDSKGATVMNVQINAETTVVDIQNLKSGMYIVKSSQGSSKFIK